MGKSLRKSLLGLVSGPQKLKINCFRLYIKCSTCSARSADNCPYQGEYDLLGGNLWAYEHDGPVPAKAKLVRREGLVDRVLEFDLCSLYISLSKRDEMFRVLDEQIGGVCRAGNGGRGDLKTPNISLLLAKLRGLNSGLKFEVKPFWQ